MSLTYEQAHVALAKRLSPGAVQHSERVAATAAWLAASYGVDVDAARVAGLLHDWHRETPPAELLRRADEFGIEISAVDEAVPYLLHGPVAEADLRHDLPDLSSEELEAIGSHTYGKPEMSPLAMVVYIADTIEPSRKQEGVEDLRRAAGVLPLRELFVETYALSLHHLVDVRRRIHPKTIATWNRLVPESAR